MEPTNTMEVFREILERIESEDIAYMIVGSVGSIIYGEPRMTKDLDVVVKVVPKDAKIIESLFPIEGFYCPPLEVLRDEIVRRGQFNLIHHESGLKVDVIVCKNAPHSQEEFKRRRRVDIWEGFLAWVASPEDVIIKKLDYYREGRSDKHLADIRGILSHMEIDEKYLHKWVSDLGLTQFWELANR